MVDFYGDLILKFHTDCTDFHRFEFYKMTQIVKILNFKIVIGIVIEIEIVIEIDIAIFTLSLLY